MPEQTDIQRWRILTQTAFFALFVLAPVLDLFRLDLNLGHFIFLGQHLSLGIDPFPEGPYGALIAGFNVLTRAILPVITVLGLLIWTGWRWGRLYCGWLCPHFSVVEAINKLMLRASGKPSVWEKKPLPVRKKNGQWLTPDARYWILVVFAVFGFAFLWAISMLTYLLPPSEIYPNLIHGELTRNQFTFLVVVTLLLSIEFAFARHLFCRFGCAIGLFQSLAWMSNDRAMVVGFDTARADACKDCNNACDNACPMRLHPRTQKRKMFTCTECAQCISACVDVQAEKSQPTLLYWVEHEKALPVVSGRPERLTQQAQIEVEN